MILGNKDFVHFHCHTYFSQFDGLSNLSNFVLEARKMGFPAIAITDHGNIMGWLQFIKECKATSNKKGEIPYPSIKPILGMEAYLCRQMNIGQYEPIVDKSGKKMQPKDFQPDGRKGNRHLNLYAMNFKGYQNLCTLSQRSWTKGFYSDPRIDIDLLSKHSEGLMGGSACLSSVINANLLYGRYEEAKKMTGVFKEIFKDNFFLEVMYHGIPEQKAIIADIFKLSSETGIPVIATNDIHYIKKEQADSQEILMCMSTARCIKDPKHMKYAHQELYLKSAEEMQRIFKDVPHCLTNSIAMAERIDSADIERNLFGGMRLPNFEIPKEFTDPFKYLEKLGWEGLKKHGWDNSPPHKEALKKELEDIRVAKENNNYDFATYFLIVKDYIDEARKKGIMVGPGRGCLSGDTLIPIGEVGEKKEIKDIIIGDKVLTKTGKLEKVLKTYSYDIKDEELYKVYTYYGDYKGVTLTRDHKVLAEKRGLVKSYNKWNKIIKNRGKNYKEPEGVLNWIETSKLEIGDWVFVPFSDYVKKEQITQFDLSQFSNNKDMIFDKTHIYEIRNIPNNGGIRNIKKFNRNLSIDENFSWILGKFIADGWLRKGKHRNNEIAFAFNKNELNQLEFVKQYFIKQGINSFYEHWNKSKSCIQLTIKSKYLDSFFRYLFKEYNFSSKTKYIPEIVFSFNKKCSASLINGLFCGDGSMIDKYGKYIYSSVSERLVYQIKELLRRHKIPSSIRKDIRKKGRSNGFILTSIKHPIIKEGAIFYKNENVFNLSLLFSSTKRCKFLENGMLTQIYKIEKINNVVRVYDLQIANESNYLTSSFVVHNSGYASVLLRCMDITYGVDPIRFNLIWERFLGFDDLQFIKESDLGFLGFDTIKVFEKDPDLLDTERDLEEVMGGVDRY